MAFSSMIEGLSTRLQVVEGCLRIVALNQAVDIISTASEEEGKELRKIVQDMFLDKGGFLYEDLRRRVMSHPLDEMNLSEFDKTRLRDLLSFLFPVQK